MNYFDDDNVNLDILKKRAYNYRWAEVDDGVIPLTAADPDYPVAPEIREAMREYIDAGYFSYTPKEGFPEFKHAMSTVLKERKGEEIPEDQILPVDSAARAMYIIAQSFLKPGDEMIVFDPCDYLFRDACLSAGATPVSYKVSLDPVNRKMDLSGLEACVTENTKMIGLCNPHNPYGLVYTKEELDYIMGICEKHELLIMNDEIWSDIIYPDAVFNSIYCLGNERCSRVMSVFGFSKSFGLAGLRIGCLYTTDRDSYEVMVDHSDVLSTAGGATSISQVAATAAMESAYYWVDDFLHHLTVNRDLAVDYINDIPHLKAYRPQGTYLLYVDIGELGMTGEEFTDFLKKEVQLAIIPGGIKFFGENSEYHVRICFATSDRILREGLARLKTGVELLNC